MSFDEISYLDFDLNEAQYLRERALAAWETERAQREHELLLVAQERIHEVLGAMNAQKVSVELSQSDDEGTVEMTVAGIAFKVQVTQGGDRVRLLAKNKHTGVDEIKDLADLGRLIAEGKLRCATD